MHVKKSIKMIVSTVFITIICCVLLVLKLLECSSKQIEVIEPTRYYFHDTQNDDSVLTDEITGQVESINMNQSNDEQNAVAETEDSQLVVSDEIEPKTTTEPSLSSIPLSNLSENIQYKFADPVTFNGEHGGSLDTNGSIIYNYFIDKGLPPSSVIGMMGYMWGEDKFDAYDYDGEDPSRGWGIGNWTDHSGRRSAMVQYASDRGRNWRGDIEIQLDYMWYELNTLPRFSDLLTYLKDPVAVDHYYEINTEEAARASAVRFSAAYGGGQSFYIQSNGEPNRTVQQQEDDYRNAYSFIEGYDPIYTHVESAKWMFNNNLKNNQ